MGYGKMTAFCRRIEVETDICSAADTVQCRMHRAPDARANAYGHTASAGNRDAAPYVDTHCNSKLPPA